MKIVLIVDNLQFFRDVFRSRILPLLLADPTVEILIATTYAPEAVARECRQPRVRVAALASGAPPFHWNLVYSLGKDLYTVAQPQGSFAQKRANEALAAGRWSLRVRLALSRWLLRRGVAWERLLRRAEAWGGEPEFGRLLDQERPALVVFSTMLPGVGEWLKAARQRHIPLVLSVASWDNPTSKGPMPVQPDYALVWTEQMGREMTAYHGMPANRLFPVGVVYFETYFQHDQLPGREEFCAGLNISPDRKILHYATGDSKLIRCNQEFIRVLHRLMESGRLGAPCHLLVRVSPKDVFSLYKDFENLPHVTVQYPKGEGTLYGGHKWLPGADEDVERAATLLHSDVVLSVSSSMVLDACCFDKPVINLAYDAGLEVKPWERVKRFFEYAHCRPVFEEDATWVVSNDQELEQAIHIALNDSASKREQRRRLLNRLIGFTDGRTHQRWVSQILALAKQKPPLGTQLKNA